MPQNAMRVLVVDDHAVVRSGVRALLTVEPELEVVGEAANADEALREATSLQPDVIVLDLFMPPGNGLDVLPKLKEAAPNAAVLILSMDDDPTVIHEAFARGGSAYVLKQGGDLELLEAVREVSVGGRYLNPNLAVRLLEHEASARSATEHDLLSEREREVLRLVALGHTNQEIAGQLYLSRRTVEMHRTHIVHKLKLSTRAELVRYAFENGLLSQSRDPGWQSAS